MCQAMPSGTRVLSPSDLEKIVKIDQEITKRSRHGFYEKRLSANNSATVALGVEENGVILGFVMAHILDGEFGGKAPVAVLNALGVSKEARGKGLAKKLMLALDSALNARGVKEVVTEAEWSEHDLVSFFAAANFSLSGRLIFERDTGRADFGVSHGYDVESLARDRVPVRSMVESDLAAIVNIDKKITGKDRTAYYRRKMTEVLKESGIQASLVAEVDGQFAGFIMASVNFGEFGRTEAVAVMDTIGVNPAFAKHGVGSALASQLIANLSSLQVEKVRTQGDWDNLSLLSFLKRCGFAPSQSLSFSRRAL